MAEKEKIIVSAYTGYLMCDFGKVHEYIQEILERPVYTHELANNNIQEEIHEKTKQDFIKICGSENAGLSIDDKLIHNEKEPAEIIIKSLNERIQMLKETVKMATFVLEKQLPRTPDYEGDGYSEGKLVYDTWICPNCGEHYEVGYHDYDYCPKCGQHIQHADWEAE